jgi:hypothetical protein
MFPKRKLILTLYIADHAIRTTADQSFFVQGKG